MSKIANAVQKASEKFIKDYDLKQPDIKKKHTVKKVFEAMEKKINQKPKAKKDK